MIQAVQVKTVGRLGNNMFQIAAAASFANSIGVRFLLPLYDAMPGTFPNLEYTYKPRSSYNDLDDCIVLRYAESGFEYKDIQLPRRVLREKDCILELDGYFQSPLYFDEELVRTIFKFDFVHDRVDDSKWKQYVSLHVRRGDYCNLQEYHPLQTLEYYRQAMDVFPGARFLVFSDDMNWCRENLVGDNIEYFHDIAHSKEFDMYVMSMCRAHIISNSTFSWWAAWLGNGKTVAPRNWFGPRQPYSTKDLIPEDWIRI